MKDTSLKDTIVARATGSSAAALAVVRLSGPQARDIADRLTTTAKSRESHRLYRVRIHDGHGVTLDDGMIVQMHGPKSYTGEDVVELHLHGSPVVVDAVVQACLTFGARLAQPGEFTLRAFLNGRMDLSQAEAVRDLIAASSEAERRVATAHLEGALSQAIGTLLEELEDVVATLHAGLDFPEQIGDVEVNADHLDTITSVHTMIARLIAQARLDLGRKRRVVLCGAPNVGKSSLLNAFAGQRRVLVDDAPGTTRDAIEVELAVGNSRIALFDTAGIRDDALGIEREGIEISLAHIDRAERSLWIVAADCPKWPPESLSLRVVVVVNKVDLITKTEKSALLRTMEQRGLCFLGFVSAHTKEGIDALIGQLTSNDDLPTEDTVVIVHERHLDALFRAQTALKRVLDGFSHMTLDVTAIELEEAARALGVILGRDVEADVLDRVFSTFCLGK